MKLLRQSAWPVALLLCAGCGFAGRESIDDPVAVLCARVDKLGRGPELKPAPGEAWPAAFALPKPPEAVRPPAPAIIQTVAVVQDVKPIPPMPTPPARLVIPPGLPGANAPPIKLPENKEERQRYVRALFPPLPSVPPLPARAPGPEGRPMTLDDLQRLGLLYSPAVKNARAAVEAAEGAVKQAGAYPNPSVFFQQDTEATGQAGYQGFSFSQVIKTANKLKLQQAAAMMDLLNARVALRRAETDMIYQVRGYYFAVLVALETERVTEALFHFTEEIYRLQVETFERNFAAGYEPMQLRPLALQARYLLLQARNQYAASWRQLTAALGLPDMPPSDVAGRVDMPVPEFDFDKVRAFVLDNHTDVLTAINSIQKAHYSLELAKVTPVPDVSVTVAVQKDLTSGPPNQVVNSLLIGGPVPLWDLNRGAIKQAEGQLRQASAQLPQSRNALLVTLADAFNRYETNRQQVAIALQQVEDQVRVFRGLSARRESDPTNVSFGDRVTAQQTLGTYVTAYVAALGLQWQAVADIANLLQNDDLYHGGAPRQMAPVPELEVPPVPRREEPMMPPEASTTRALPSIQAAGPSFSPQRAQRNAEEKPENDSVIKR